MNNMYDILGKINSLTPQEKEVEAKKPVYESVEARGSIVAGVKDIEQKLREQFEAAKEERETLKTKSGTIYKGGSYGTEYDVGDDGSKKPKAKHVPKTGQKGRPKKERPASFDAPKGDIFGRTTGKVPKGKGTVVKGKAMSHDANNVKDELDEAGMRNPYAIGMAQAKKEIGLGKARATGLPKKTIKRGHHIADVIKSQTNEGRKQVLTMLAEGVNFTEMMKERGRGVDELLGELQADIKAFKETGHCSDFLRDAMEVHGYGKKQLTDAVKGDSFAPQHPATPIPAPSFLDKAKAFGQKALNTLGHGSDDELLGQLERETGGKRPNRFNEDEELNELARLAGLQVAEAAKPDFTDVDKDGDEKESWKKAEKDKEEVDESKSPKADKDYDGDGEVESEKDEVIGSRRKAAGLDECMSPLAGGAAEMHQAEEQKGRITVSTNASSDGNNSVNISADGEAAEQLMQMLKMAGLGGGEAHAQQAAIVVAQEAKAYGDTDVEEAPDAMNKPRPDVRGAHRAETVGFANTSDDLHKQKDQHSDAAAKGDNPLTKKEKAVENFNPLDQLGAQLMAEYQSIKLQK